MITILLAAHYAPISFAAELVYVEWKDCASCMRFNKQMAREYATSEIGKKIVLRRVNILGPWPADLKHVSRPPYTPVFILVDGGREVGRFNGYTSPQQFKHNLRRLMQRLN